MSTDKLEEKFPAFFGRPFAFVSDSVPGAPRAPRAFPNQDRRADPDTMMRWIAALLLCALLAPAPALCASPRVHLGAAAAPGGRHLLGRHLLVDYTPEQTGQSLLISEAFFGPELSSGCRDIWKVRLGLIRPLEHARRRRRRP